MTADAKTKTYGDADPALTYQITTGTLVSGDAFTGALAARRRRERRHLRDHQGTLALGANYALTFVGANLTISQRAITVTADAEDQDLRRRRPGADLPDHHRLAGRRRRLHRRAGARAGENVGHLRDHPGHAGAERQLRAHLRRRQPDDHHAGDHGHRRRQDQDLRRRRSGADLPITSGVAGQQRHLHRRADPRAGENVGAYAISQGTLAPNTNYALTFVGANLDHHAAAGHGDGRRRRPRSTATPTRR